MLPQNSLNFDDVIRLTVVYKSIKIERRRLKCIYTLKEFGEDARIHATTSSSLDSKVKLLNMLKPLLTMVTQPLILRNSPAALILNRPDPLHLFDYVAV